MALHDYVGSGEEVHGEQELDWEALVILSLIAILSVIGTYMGFQIIGYELITCPGILEAVRNPSGILLLGSLFTGVALFLALWATWNVLRILH